MNYFKTTNDLVELFSLIAYQKWTIKPWGVIRNSSGQCPLVSLFSEISQLNTTEVLNTNASFKLLDKEFLFFSTHDYKIITKIILSVDFCQNQLRKSIIKTLEIN